MARIQTDSQLSTSFFQFADHPFRLLRRVECLFLGMSIVAELPWSRIPFLETFAQAPTQTYQWMSFSPMLVLLCIAILALMGMRLPTGQLAGKVLYIAIALGLIWLTIALEGGRSPFMTLYLVVIIRSCLMFPSLGYLIVTAIVFLSCFLSILLLQPDVQTLRNWFFNPQQIDPERSQLVPWIWTINYFCIMGLSTFLLLLLVRSLIAENRSRQELAIAHTQLQKYALRIEDQAMLQERNRIAREIHDSLGHALTAQDIQLQNAIRFFQLNPEKSLNSIHSAKQLGKTALHEVRQSVSALRVVPIERRSLATLIHDLVKEFHQAHALILKCQINLPESIPIDVEIAVYRIAQECFTNIIKHSQAAEVALQLNTDQEWLYFTIRDDGRGFNIEQNISGFGLQGMRERAIALDGTFQIISQPGAGCCVTVKLPLVKF
ncbi:sensor histidine kinase [Phormidesmis sp. 146-33]